MQLTLHNNPLRCDEDFCWYLNDTMGVVLEGDQKFCLSPHGFTDFPLLWLNRGHLRCVTGTISLFCGYLFCKFSLAVLDTKVFLFHLPLVSDTICSIYI